MYEIGIEFLSIDLLWYLCIMILNYYFVYKIINIFFLSCLGVLFFKSVCWIYDIYNLFIYWLLVV